MESTLLLLALSHTVYHLLSSLWCSAYLSQAPFVDVFDRTCGLHVCNFGQIRSKWKKCKVLITPIHVMQGNASLMKLHFSVKLSRGNRGRHMYRHKHWGIWLCPNGADIYSVDRSADQRSLFSKIEKYHPDYRYPDELLQYLRLIQLNKDQLRGRTLEDLSFEKKQTDVNELMVLDSLAEACKATIAGYPTTVGPAKRQWRLLCVDASNF